MRQIDFGQVANSYARSREDIPATLMDSLQLRNIFFTGKKVADIAAGTGELTRKIAMRKAEVVGVEPSVMLLEQAKALNIERNFTISYLQGTAEATGLETSQFDIVTVMRGWHWFDRPNSIQEIQRILKPNGTLIVIDSGLISGCSIVEETFEVLGKYVDGGLKPEESMAEDKQRINGFPVEWFAEWQSSGFEIRDFYKLNFNVNFTKQEWLERMESVSPLAGLEETVRMKALEDLSDSLPNQESYDIPHDCNVCLLRLID